MVIIGTSFVAEFVQAPTGSPGSHKSQCHVKSVCTQGWDPSTYLTPVKSISWKHPLSCPFKKETGFQLSQSWFVLENIGLRGHLLFLNTNSICIKWLSFLIFSA